MRNTAKIVPINQRKRCVFYTCINSHIFIILDFFTKKILLFFKNECKFFVLPVMRITATYKRGFMTHNLCIFFCGEIEVATTKFNSNNATININKG